MWKVEIPSEGDLTNENYLMIEDKQRFEDILDIISRRSFVISCIKRLSAELDMLNDPEVIWQYYEALHE